MKRKLLFGVLLLTMAACSPGFYMRAAYEETKILWGRDDIEDVIEDPDTAIEEREKLALVLDAREFAIKMGLDPKSSFTKYSHVDKDVLLWVLAGSKKDSFSVYEWWFPFVGKAPYKGFFDKDDALREAEYLHGQHFETFLRGSDAFSTLGWFNDPVLTTTLRSSPENVVNTVIHETLHSTLWIPGNVPFNESLANFVGLQGAVEFYEQATSNPSLRRKADSNVVAKELEAARRGFKRELFVADVVENLYNQLDELYKTDFTRERKLSLRNEVFTVNVESLRKFYPELTILTEINNAEIMQFKFYMTGLREFQAVYLHHKGDWGKFIAHMAKVKEALEEDPKLDPFDVMKKVKI